MQSRLDELRNIEQKSDSHISSKSEKIKNNDEVRQFMKCFEDFGDNILAIKECSKNIKKLEAQANEERIPYEDIFAELNVTIGESRTEAKTANDKIINGKKILENFEKSKSKEPQNGSTTLLKNILDTNLSEFQSVTRQFNTSSEAFRESLRSKIKRRAKVVHKDLSDQQLENLVNSPDPGSFLRKQLQVVHDDVLQRVEEIEERYENIKKIEEGVLEINRMFNDLAILVELQDEKLQVIEENVLATKERVVHANEELEAAKGLQKKANRCCVLM
ncbi:Syntaxin-2 [Bonamia ostreae]|uniref:Syntaxin-2 n=1 Tax=Bonamia ostreae TaxID=126728 RepID=A0ABV2ALS2_9EUKA